VRAPSPRNPIRAPGARDVRGALAGLTARAAYSLGLRLLLPAYLLRLWWRGRREPLYRRSIAERLGRYGTAPRPEAGPVWIHAVSLGETRAAASLIAALREQQPRLRLLLTHGTATGRETGASLLRPGDIQVWLPFDTPGAVRRFLARFRPRLGVLMETEVWPNLLHAAHAQSVPMVLANARLSPKSLRQSLRFDALLRPAAQCVTLALAQTQGDAARLREAGAPRVEVVGNLKFDMAPDPALIERGRAWHAALGRAVMLAASTREGEEAPLIDAWLERPAPRPLLLLVPRHPQRFDEVAALVAERRLSVARRSEFAGAPAPAAAVADVWLGDSIGEMPMYYALADVALLGGSFAPLGGQNLIEAAACGCPLLMGPHTFNFAEAAELSVAAGASARVASIAEGVQRGVALPGTPEREAMAHAALAFAAQHRGAAARMAQRLAQILSERD
jgi:3-deoxy-D-manno-octulosonic-acid transferase